MGKRPDWRAEQEAAERARTQARSHLQERGVAWDEASRDKLRQDGDKDNTLDLVRKRKAQQLLEAGAGQRQHQQDPDPAPKNQEQEPVPAPASASSSATARALVRPPHGWTIEDMLAAPPAASASSSDDAMTPTPTSTKVFRHLSSGCAMTRVPLRGKGPDASETLGVVLPHGWKLLKDETSGRYYFWHVPSGKVQFDLVEECDEVPAAAAAPEVPIKSERASSAPSDNEPARTEPIKTEQSALREATQSAGFGGIQMKLGLGKTRKKAKTAR